MTRRLAAAAAAGALALTLVPTATPASARPGPDRSSVGTEHLLTHQQVVRQWPAFAPGSALDETPAAPAVLTGCEGQTTPLVARDAAQRSYVSDTEQVVGWQMRVQVYELRSRRDGERMLRGLRRQTRCPVTDSPDLPPVALAMPRLGQSRAAIEQEYEGGPEERVRTYMVRRKARVVVLTVWDVMTGRDLPSEQAVLTSAWRQATSRTCHTHGNGRGHGHRHCD